MKTLQNTVWAEEPGVQVTLELDNGLVMMTIADSDGEERKVSITFARWSRLCEVTGYVPREPDPNAERWGRGMFIAGAAAGITRKRK